jgi:4-amino-4-deoxy-L-arabinose transferase-like glycosyltransferase
MHTLDNAETSPGTCSRGKVSPLVWILALGAGVRLLLWLWFGNQPIHIEDEQHYNEIAVNLVRDGEFASPAGHLTSLRPPLYPAFLALTYSVFGLENFQAVRLLQAGLSLLTVLVVYQLGCLSYSKRVGYVLAALCCFYPSLLGYNNLLLTEVLFTLLLCVFCLAVVASLRAHSFSYLAFAGIALGLAALTRSVVWLFPPILGLFLLVAWKEAAWRRLAAAATFGIVFAATIAPWAIRNTRLQQTFVAIDVMGGRNFMMGNYEHTPLYRSWDAIGLTGDKAWWRMVAETYPTQEKRTQGQIDQLAFRLGLTFIAENPGLTLQRAVIKFFDFWGMERELVAGASRGWFGALSKAAVFLIAAAICAGYALALFLGVFGIFTVPPDDRRIHWFLLLLVVFVCGMHTLVFGHSRYHLPLMPIVLLYAASALVSAAPIWRKRHRWTFRLACAACVILVAGWVWLFFAVDLQLSLTALAAAQ